MTKSVSGSSEKEVKKQDRGICMSRCRGKKEIKEERHFLNNFKFFSFSALFFHEKKFFQENMFITSVSYFSLNEIFLSYEYFLLILNFLDAKT